MYSKKFRLRRGGEIKREKRERERESTLMCVRERIGGLEEVVVKRRQFYGGVNS
jgi:hypothetical protein